MSTPRDLVHAVLFSANGTTRYAWLPNARAIVWRDELSRAGTVTFEVPLDDPTTARIHERRIVRFTWYRNGRARQRFACRIASEGIELAADGRRWLRFEAQPGLLSMIGDAVVYPEYGLHRHSAADRLCGFMSKAGGWRVDANWRDVVGTAFGAMGGVRKGHPPELKRSAPYWIGAINPETWVSESTVNYFRGHVSVDHTTRAEVVATADNFLTMYLDGEQIITPDPSNSLGWRSAFTQPIILTPGDHLIAAKIANADRTTFGGRSPIGFIMTIFEVNSAGKRIGTLMKTDLSTWAVHDNSPEPGWYRAQVLRQFLIEAKARGVAGPSLVNIGWTDYHDSYGRPWAHRGEYSFRVGVDSLIDVAAQLTEADLELTFDTLSMTVKAWQRYGRDRSASVTLKTGERGGNLKSCVLTTTHTRFNSILSQLSDGTWLNTRDAASVDAIGVVESGLSLGSTDTDRTAASVARSQLGEAGSSKTTITVETSTLTGPVPGIDYWVGDTISVPGPRGASTIKARVLAVTVDASGETVRAWPELMEVS